MDLDFEFFDKAADLNDYKGEKLLSWSRQLRDQFVFALDEHDIAPANHESDFCQRVFPLAIVVSKTVNDTAKLLERDVSGTKAVCDTGRNDV